SRRDQGPSEMAGGRWWWRGVQACWQGILIRRWVAFLPGHPPLQNRLQLPHARETIMIVVRTLPKRAATGISSFLATATLLAPSLPSSAADDETRSAITSNGITVEFATRAVGRDQDGDKILAGQDVELRFKLADAMTGTAISNARAAIWIDARKKTGFMMQKPGDADGACREKIAAFLQGGLSYRPDIDLNSW